jgi:hypothetical protein
MLFLTSSGKIELNITKNQAKLGYHAGDCENSIKQLLRHPAIRKQIDALDVETVKAELREYGAWEETELLDHEFNKIRLLWLACADIFDNHC